MLLGAVSLRLTGLYFALITLSYGVLAQVARPDCVAPDRPEALLAWATVVDGKLYLNYNHDVQAEWAKDIAGYIGKADANWPKVLAEK